LPIHRGGPHPPPCEERRRESAARLGCWASTVSEILWNPVNKFVRSSHGFDQKRSLKSALPRRTNNITACTVSLPSFFLTKSEQVYVIKGIGGEKTVAKIYKFLYWIFISTSYQLFPREPDMTSKIVF
jgi:hypothetical protein